MCNPGFQLYGADRATCRSSGWDAAPTCGSKTVLLYCFYDKSVRKNVKCVYNIGNFNLDNELNNVIHLKFQFS